MVESNICSIEKIGSFDKEKKNTIKSDLKKIVGKRKNILGIKFDTPQIMGVLNVTPDSFSDGGLFFEENKAYEQANVMINVV